MPNKKISQLDRLSSANLDNLTVIVASGTTYNIDLATLQQLFNTYTREILTLPVPSDGDTVIVRPSNIDTVVSFENNLTDNFTINVEPTVTTRKGDRIYIMVKGAHSGIVMSFSGQFNDIMCGGQQTQYTINTYMNMFEFVYDGTNFTGIDNC